MKKAYKAPRLRGIPTKKKKAHLRRCITIATLLLIVSGLTTLTLVRWNAWFGNKPEAPYTTPEEITRITMVPGEDFSHQRVFSWRSGEQIASSSLSLRKLSNKGDTLPEKLYPALGSLIESRSGKGCYYHVSLDSLEEGATYLYQLKSGRSTSPIYSFSMPSGLQDSLRFIYMGDVQDPEGRMSKQFFQELSQSYRDSIQFFAFAGDQIEGPTDAYWQTWYNSLSGINTHIPILAAPGNHEYLKRGFARELDVRWIPQFNYPANGPKDYLRRSYYVDFPLVRFIILDTTDIMWLGSINQHKAWLKQVLSESKQPWQVVLFHHAVDCVREGRKNVVMHYIFKDELISYGADLILQGHDHGYARSTTRSKNHDTIAPAFIISSASPKVYRNGFSSVHDRLGSGLQLYQDITVTQNQIHYKSYRFPEEPTPRDSVPNRSLYLYDELVLYKGKDGIIRVEDKARSLPELFLFNSFGTDSKAHKKAAQYAKEIQERAAARKSSTGR